MGGCATLSQAVSVISHKVCTSLPPLLVRASHTFMPSVSLVCASGVDARHPDRRWRRRRLRGCAIDAAVSPLAPLPRDSIPHARIAHRVSEHKLRVSLSITSSCVPHSSFQPRSAGPRAVFRGARVSSTRLGPELPRDVRHPPPYGCRSRVGGCVQTDAHARGVRRPTLSDFWIEVSYLTFAYEFRSHTST